MKKIFSAIISSSLKGRLCGLLFALLATTTLLAYDFQSGDLYYNITSSSAPYTVEVADATSSITIAAIPETVTYNGTTYSVTSIGYEAFYGCSSLTSITIPEGVTSIGSDAFYRCSSLTTVTIPESVTSIGYSAFHDCSSLTDITIPNSVTSIGSWAFAETPWYNNLSDGVIYIGKVLYEYKGTMPANTSINIKDGIVSISPNAFSDCSSLTSVTIPNSVTSIGFCAFEYCSSLTSINIPEGVTNIEAYTFHNCSSLTSITIPNNVKSVEHSAFSGCSSLASITFPDDIISIDEYAFNGTSWYTNQPDGVIYVGKVLYKYKGDMPANTNIAIKDGTISISPQAFQKCSTLISVVIPNSVTSIGRSAFSSCSSLSSVTIGKNVTSIGFYAFAYCPSLTSITIPNSVTSIGDHAFYSCSSLTSATIGNSLTSIGDDAFDGCSSLRHIEWNAKKHKDFEWNKRPFENSPISLFIFGDSVEYIPAYLCRGMDSLKTITIPNSVDSIGHAAFYDCSSLTSATIGNSLTSIGSSAFLGCSSLTSITIGNSVTSIGEEAFAECSSLSSIIIPNSVTSIGAYAFRNCNSLNKTNYLGNITDWCNIKFGGWYANPVSQSYNLYINDKEVKDIVIPSTIDTIYGYAFHNDTSLTSVVIPNSVTSIGWNAFEGCSNLASITIPNSVTSIGSSAFSGCLSLRSAIIGSGVPKIEDNTFKNCSTLSWVAMGSRVENIGNQAFSACPIDTLFLRNPTPPTFESLGISKNSISRIYVPCGSYSAYKNSSWNNYAKYSRSFEDDNVFFLNTNVTDSVAGRVETVSEANCDKGYTIKAVPIVGYEFVQWSDGVTDALRTLDLTQDTTLIAEFRQLFDGKCGDNLYWKHYDDKIIIHGEGAMYDYAADSVPWYQFRDIVKTVEVFDGATSIGNNAFTLCKNLNTLTLSGTIENIGENAFGGCRMLFDIYCYVLFPPIASETSFINYNAYLYILCDYQRYYAVDMVFGNFRNMQCIGTQSTPTDSMVITPSYNDVTITWPTLSNAGSYTLAINKDGEVFCTLTFNAAGQLTGIAFAPSRNGQRHAPAATQAANGFTFTVTGLEEGTDYSYNLVIKDNSGKTLQTYSGEFRTQSTNDRTVTVEYDAAQGQVTGAGTYLVGDTVTLTAIPNDGYRFVRWSNEVEDNPYTFVISDNVTLSAEFEEVITTSVENTTPSQQSDTHKLLRDGQLLIIRDGKTYNIMGAAVK